ncbi:MAG: hypothetical protein J6L91_02585 [Clostridia bacterium]|nr:hypothetical protein [Clostridia bacterium]
MNFNALTVFVLANNETDLLRVTVDEIKKACNRSDLAKITVVVKNNQCKSFFETQKIMETDSAVELYVQKAPTAELCLAELAPMVTTSHFVIMAADLEMSPASLTAFIKKAKQHPNRIVCAAKWLKGSSVNGYGFLHACCSKTMNRIISILFNKKVYDPFSIFQIYPIELYKKMDFSNPETLLYEYTLKPLSMGEEYEEIPTVYNKRKSGKSNFKLPTLIRVATKFLYTGFKIRFNLR